MPYLSRMRSLQQKDPDQMLDTLPNQAAFKWSRGSRRAFSPGALIWRVGLKLGRLYPVIPGASCRGIVVE